jgi:hypothetical protein
MALLEIPTDNTGIPSYEQAVQLDGTTYILALYFNPRINDGEGKWFLTLADQNRNMLVGPVPVTVNWPLFDRFIDQVELPGMIFAFDTSGNNLDPTQFTLGTSVRLYYLEAGSTL